MCQTFTVLISLSRSLPTNMMSRLCSGSDMCLVLSLPAVCWYSNVWLWLHIIHKGFVMILCKDRIAISTTSWSNPLAAIDQTFCQAQESISYNCSFCWQELRSRLCFRQSFFLHQWNDFCLDLYFALCAHSCLNEICTKGPVTQRNLKIYSQASLTAQYILGTIWASKHHFLTRTASSFT